MADNDDLISQFLAFTGSADTERAASYLEMSGGNVETAVGLYMEHQGAGGAGAGGGGGELGGFDIPPDTEIRAPDATQTMRLMDDGGGGGGMHGMNMHHPYMQMDPMIEEQLANSAFAAPSLFADAREAVNAAAAAEAENDDSKEDMDDEDYVPGVARAPSNNLERLADMFAPPEHLIYKEGGFEGARTMAKDNKRWLLVNLQRDSEFSCHALNRDVWRDELVENLVREGFIFWQAVSYSRVIEDYLKVDCPSMMLCLTIVLSFLQMDISPEGQTYSQRYHVHDYPHIAIIDPRTRRLMWKKEGWTQEKPMTAELFAETAMDFCSRHSFDKPPVAPRPPGATARPAKRAMHEMSEDEQLQAAMRASLKGGDDDDAEAVMEDDDDDDVEYLGTKDDMKPEAAPAVEEKQPSLMDELVAMPIEDEPESGARIQFRMPDGKRQVRKFAQSDTVKSIYAFVAVSASLDWKF
jgi:hypothetical protein